MNSPIILSIETSGINCGVSLVRDGGVRSEYSHWTPNIHDRMLATLCEHILQADGISVGDLDAVAVSEGPGSFTGLRIGCAFAKALCFGNKPRLIAVPTLKALAASAGETAELLRCTSIGVVIASQIGKYYYQMFDTQSNPLSDTILCDRATILEMLSVDSFVCGTAASEFATHSSLENFNRLSPTFISALAVRLYDEAHFQDAETFVPRYVQDFVPRMTV